MGSQVPLSVLTLTGKGHGTGSTPIAVFVLTVLGPGSLVLPFYFLTLCQYITPTVSLVFPVDDVSVVQTSGDTV